MYLHGNIQIFCFASADRFLDQFKRQTPLFLAKLQLNVQALTFFSTNDFRVDINDLFHICFYCLIF